MGNIHSVEAKTLTFINTTIDRRRGILFIPTTIWLLSCGSNNQRYENDFVKANATFPRGLNRPEFGIMEYTLKPSLFKLPTLPEIQRPMNIIWPPFSMSTTIDLSDLYSVKTIWGIGKTNENRNRRAWIWILKDIDKDKGTTVRFEWERWILKNPTRDGRLIPLT